MSYAVRGSEPAIFGRAGETRMRTVGPEPRRRCQVDQTIATGQSGQTINEHHPMIEISRAESCDRARARAPGSQANNRSPVVPITPTMTYTIVIQACTMF